MNLELLLPFARDHAVQSVVLAAEWQGELSDQTLLRVHSLHKELQTLLPKVDLQKMMQINLTPSDVTSTQTFPSLGAVVFQRASELGAVARQLTITRQSCSFVINDYTRWNPTLEDAMGLFGSVIPIILADKPISAIGLQYTDVFTWKDDPALMNLREVLKESSPYLPANVFNLAHAWHSHHGYIENGKHESEQERLNNINVNVLDVAGERTIQITVAQRAALKKPLRLSTENFMDVVKSLQDQLHVDSKEILSQVLSDGVTKKIKLKNGG